MNKRKGSGRLRARGGFGALDDALSLRAARRWQVWVVPHEHLDVGYTDDPAKTAELHSRVLDDAAALSLRHPGFAFTVHGSLFTGSASLEGLVRTLYPSRALSREHGFPFDVAVVTDVPSCSWSFASVLASAGIRHFVAASDAYRGPFLLRNRLHEIGHHEWEGPDGGRLPGLLGVCVRC